MAKRPFKGPEQISLPEAMTLIKSGDVDSVGVTGDSIRLTLDDGTELTTTMDAASSLEETLSYFGVTQAIIAENKVELLINDQSTWNTIFHLDPDPHSSAAHPLALYARLSPDARRRRRRQ
ncbi:MAG: hypothetical protein M5U34_39790 [Chloroflexi bacterium]|nr:hypothetical protein [Chloroflexota bacterium]